MVSEQAQNLDMDQMDMTESQGSKLVIVSAVLAAVQTFVVAGRLLVRRKKGLQIRLEDYLIIPAYLFSLAVCIVTITLVPLAGLGRHIEAAKIINPNARGLLMQFNFINHILSYTLAIVFAKVSILVFYCRVFQHQRYMKVAAYFVGTVVIGTGLAAFLAPLVVCRPMNWLFSEASAGGSMSDSTGEGHCVAWQWYLTYLSVPNIATDLVIIYIPLATIWTLSMNLAQKVGMSFAFTLGGLHIFTSCLRLAAFVRWADPPFSPDTSWSTATPSLWNVVEVSTLIIAACIPHLRPLIALIVPRGLGREPAFDPNKNTGRGRVGPLGKALGFLDHLFKRAGADTRAWVRMQGAAARSMVVRGWETWEELPSGEEEERARKGRAEGRRRTAQWIMDLEAGGAGGDGEGKVGGCQGTVALGTEKPGGMLPLDGIMCVEEVVVISETRRGTEEVMSEREVISEKFGGWLSERGEVKSDKMGFGSEIMDIMSERLEAMSEKVDGEEMRSERVEVMNEKVDLDEGPSVEENEKRNRFDSVE